MDQACIHAIDLLRRNFVCFRQIGQRIGGHGRRLRRGNRPPGAVLTVVLAKKQHRQFVKRCEVERFRRRAFFQGTIAEQANRDAAVFLRFRSVGRAGGERNDSGDDAGAMKKAQRRRDGMKRTALAFVQAVDAAEDFGKKRLGSAPRASRWPWFLWVVKR